MQEFIVKAEEAGKRIDVYLSSKNEDISRVAIHAFIRRSRKASPIQSYIPILPERSIRW